MMYKQSHFNKHAKLLTAKNCNLSLSGVPQCGHILVDIAYTVDQKIFQHKYHSKVVTLIYLLHASTIADLIVNS